MHTHALPLALAAAALSSHPAVQDEHLAPGAERAAVGALVPDFELPRLDWHDGRTRLAQYVGHPVLFVGWRQWIPEPSGLHGAWFANVLSEEYAEDGLVVVLQDRGRWSEERWWGARSFWIRSFGAPVLFSAAHPERAPDLPIVRTESARDDRSLVLIGVDGTLLFEGVADLNAEGPVNDRVEELIEDELDRRRGGWGEDGTLKRARALAFGKGRWSEALRKLEQSDALAEEIAVARAEIEAGFDAALVSVAHLLDQGHFLEAEERWEDLAKAARRHAPFEAAVARFEVAFDGAEARLSRKLDRELTKVLAPVEDEDYGGVDLDVVFALRALAAEHPDHPVGRRAARIEPLVSDLARITRGIGSTAKWEQILREREKDGR